MVDGAGTAGLLLVHGRTCVLKDPSGKEYVCPLNSL
jgi:hypothetical protein